MKLSFNRGDHIHFIGIRGVAMTALAQIFSAHDFVRVTGSDTPDSFFAHSNVSQRMEDLDIEIFSGFDPKRLDPAPKLIIYSPAYGDDNPEIAYARQNNLTMFSGPEIIGQISRLFDNTISVTGTHGKTTTSAWLAHVFHYAGRAPCAMVGSTVPQWNYLNALTSRGKYFITEACEYREHFLHQQPHDLIITNIEHDHPDYYPTPDDYLAAFVKFADNLKESGLIITCIDDPGVEELLKKIDKPTLTYGLKRGDLQAHQIRLIEGGLTFEVGDLGEFCIQLPGEHNVLNALAVIAAATRHNIPLALLKAGLADFTGTLRRFQRHGEVNDCLVIDDYGHHPTEIKATLSAARQLYPDRQIKVVFTPHTVTRTLHLFDDFKQSFSDADEVFITEVYASEREETDDANWGEKLAEAISGAKYSGDIDQSTKLMKQQVAPNSVIITLGAGEGYKIAKELVKDR